MTFKTRYLNPNRTFSARTAIHSSFLAHGGSYFLTCGSLSGINNMLMLGIEALFGAKDTWEDGCVSAMGRDARVHTTSRQG